MRIFHHLRRALLLTLLLCAPWGCGFFSHSVGEHRLTILYFGDLHGRLLAEDNPSGTAGFARLTGLVNRIRRENREAGIPTLLLVAGDCLQGSPVSTLFRGEAEFRALNLLRPDAMVLGNHEFDYGLPRLRELIAMADFPVLAANVTDADGSAITEPMAIHYFDHYFVATIGTVTEETPSLTSPANVTGLTFQPARNATWEAYNTVRYTADLFIALTHQGLARDELLARQLSQISLVVGGHDHLALTKPRFVRDDCLVMQAGSNGRHLGRLDLVFHKETARGTPHISHWDNRLIPIDRTLPEDREMAELLAGYDRQATAAYGKPLGRLEECLEGGRSEVRTRTTTLGRLVARLMREATGADAALVNSGSIRESIGPGEVSLADVITALPFDNRVVLLSVSGTELAGALEHGSVADGSGAFLQLAGIEVRPDGGSPSEILVGGRPLDPAGTYRVAVNDFLADGGDGYGPWLDRLPEERRETWFLVRDLVAEELRRP